MSEEAQLQETANEASAPSDANLGVADISNAAQIIDVAVQRGAFRANEASQVGEVYNKLFAFVSAVQAQQEAQQEQGAKEETTAAAE